MSMSALTWALSQRDASLEERAVLVLLAECHSPQPDQGCQVDLCRLAKDERIHPDHLEALLRSLERSGKIARHDAGRVLLACDAGFVPTASEQEGRS